MMRKIESIVLSLALAFACVPVATGQTVIARWSMDAAPGNVCPIGNPTGNPGTADSRIAFGEGGAFGACDPFGSQEDLYFFSADNNHLYTTSVDVPPVAMFANGNNGGTVSYDASAVLPTFGEGALFFPTDLYGNEFAFFDAFTIELFFKTNGDQSAGGVQELLYQAEGFFAMV